MFGGSGLALLGTTEENHKTGYSFLQIEIFPRSASYPMSTGALSLGESFRGVKLTTHLHLVPRSKNAWSYTSTPIRLHGVMLSEAQGQLYLCFPNEPIYNIQPNACIAKSTYKWKITRG
jgi:hypothetical protein